MQKWIRKMGNGLTAVMQQIVPDAYIFCLLLTIVAMCIAVVATQYTPWQVIDMWGNGFWGMLTFSMQSALALLGGAILSQAALFRKGLSLLAGLPRTHEQAIVLASLCSLGLWYFHWGVGCAATGIVCLEIARQAAKKGIQLHYPLLVAGSYMGTVIWHNGISGASQLLVATEDHFLAAQIGVIDIGQTIFAPGNLVIVVGLLVLVPWLARMMIPEENAIQPPPPHVIEDSSDHQKTAFIEQNGNWLTAFLNCGPFCNILFGGLGVIYLYFWFGKWQGAFDLNSFIIIILIAGLLLHGNMKNYLNSLQHSVQTAIPIMLQFQFYGGILGILTSSGLIALIANFFISISTVFTYPLLAFLSAGLVNFFVPSGGGQWIVQGQILIHAAQELGVSIPRVVTAFASGDAWTNLLQPFWCLPLLVFANLRMRDIMGYCAVIWIFSFFVIAAGLLLGSFPG